MAIVPLKSRINKIQQKHEDMALFPFVSFLAKKLRKSWHPKARAEDVLELSPLFYSATLRTSCHGGFQFLGRRTLDLGVWDGRSMRLFASTFPVSSAFPGASAQQRVLLFRGRQGIFSVCTAFVAKHGCRLQRHAAESCGSDRPCML